MRHRPEALRSSVPPVAVGILVVAVGMLTAGCSGPASDGRLAEQELLARSMLAAWEAGDSEALAEYFWPDALYDDFSNSVTWQGVQEIIAYKNEIHRWATGVSVNVTRVHPSATGVTAEWVLYATQVGAVEGLTDSVSGGEIVLNGVTVLEIEGGSITRAADYIDALPLVLQLGGRVEMPGGEVLRRGEG